MLTFLNVKINLFMECLKIFTFSLSVIKVIYISKNTVNYAYTVYCSVNTIMNWLYIYVENMNELYIVEIYKICSRSINHK